MTTEQRQQLEKMGFGIGLIVDGRTVKPKAHRIDCPVCEAAWSYPKAKPMQAGALLALLNHKQGHEVNG